MVKYRIITKLGTSMTRYHVQELIYGFFWRTIDYYYTLEKAENHMDELVYARDFVKNFKSEVIRSE